MTAAHRLLWVLRALLGAVLLFAGVAHAAVPKVSGWRLEDSGIVSPSFPSKEAVCASSYAQEAVDKRRVATGYTSGTPSWQDPNCVAVFQPGDVANGWLSIQPVSGACPANSDPLDATSCQCKPGYVEQAGQCVQNQCASKLGQTRIVRWTLGYVRSPDDDDYKYVGGGPNIQSGNVCVEGCSYGVGAAVKGWRSQSPTPQGLYRLSVDVESTGLGTSCTVGATSPENPAAPEPQCPGYVGDVNGKTGCYGTAQKPVMPVNVPGSMPRDTVAGNPAAGAKPSSGEGSGNDGPSATPTNGNGGNAGGPAAAAVGGKGGGAGGTSSGTGTTTKPGEGEEQQNCGAPGQPVCAVKVDENGTPANVSNADGYGQGVDTFKDAQKTAIDGAGDKAKTSIGEFGLPFELPSGCSALPSGAFNIVVDICQWQGLIHNLMALVWLSVTAWACIGMVGRTLQGGS